MMDLINLQAKHLDTELVDLIPALQYVLLVPEHQENYEVASSPQYDEMMKSEIDEESQFIQQTCGIKKNSQSRPEKKLLERQEEIQYLVQDSRAVKKNCRKKGKSQKTKKKESYPTKNFLPNFKKPHLNFLRKFLNLSHKEFLEDNFIRKLSGKQGISLKDYEILYCTKDFHAAWEAMFKRKYLYHQLLLSRSIKKTKKNHAKKICVFEKAFREQMFKNINY